jgi:CHAD domain-containing protein
MRVAVRRLRAILRAARTCSRPRRWTRYAAAGLARRGLGVRRDLDVMRDHLRENCDNDTVERRGHRLLRRWRKPGGHAPGQ